MTDGEGEDVRVRYFSGRLLTAREFGDEQSYDIVVRHRDDVASDAWGIVTGLDVDQHEDGSLFVSPGMAVDGFGRELVLREAVSIGEDTLREAGASSADVWLVCRRTRGSDPNDDRGIERPAVHLTSPRGHERRTPVDPVEVPPDDAERRWPIFLGRVVRHPDPPPVFEIDVTGRQEIRAEG